MSRSASEIYDELRRAVDKLKKNQDVPVCFRVCSAGEGMEGSIAIESEVLDNVYDELCDWRWAIVLNPDGTWRIQ